MINTAFSQRIKLKFHGITADKVDLISVALSELGSLDQYECVPSRGIIMFRYDASKIRLEDCLSVLKALNVTLNKRSWWWRWRVKLAFQLDANIRANAKHVPHCCGKPPSGPRR